MRLLLAWLVGLIVLCGGTALVASQEGIYVRSQDTLYYGMDAFWRVGAVGAIGYVVLSLTVGLIAWLLER